MLNVVNLVVLGLIGLMLLRATVHEVRRRRRVEWRLQILELLAASVRRGRALAPVLERAAIGEPSRLATICCTLAERLNEGMLLSRALEDAAPDCFPKACIAAIAGAEGSNALADALDDLVSRTDEHQGLTHRMRVAFTYPLILAVYYLASHATTWQALSWLHPGGSGDRLDAGGLIGSGILGLLLLFVIKPHALLKPNRSLGRWLHRITKRIASRTKNGRLLASGEFLAALSHGIAAGVALPAAIRRVASTAGEERLEHDLARAAAALDEGIDAESAWRRTWLPEFAIVSISSCASSSPASLAGAMRHAASECRRRWLHRKDRSLAVMPLLCIAVIGALMAIDFVELQQMQVQVAKGVQLW